MAGVEDRPCNECGGNYQVEKREAQPKVVGEYHSQDNRAVVETAGFIPTIVEGLVISINASN